MQMGIPQTHIGERRSCGCGSTGCHLGGIYSTEWEPLNVEHHKMNRAAATNDYSLAAAGLLFNRSIKNKELLVSVCFRLVYLGRRRKRCRGTRAEEVSSNKAESPCSLLWLFSFSDRPTAFLNILQLSLYFIIRLLSALPSHPRPPPPVITMMVVHLLSFAQ